MMNKCKAFLQKKNVVLSFRRYGLDALSAMAQGLFCTLLVGTILNTIGQQLHIGFLTTPIVTVGAGSSAVSYTVGGLASAMVGPGIAVAVGAALACPPLVLLSLIPVGYAANALAGAGGPLAVYLVTIAASELGKLISRETRVDILVTPCVTVLTGIAVALVIAAPIGRAAQAVGYAIMWATPSCGRRSFSRSLWASSSPPSSAWRLRCPSAPLRSALPSASPVSPAVRLSQAAARR